MFSRTIASTTSCSTSVCQGRSSSSQLTFSIYIVTKMADVLHPIDHQPFYPTMSSHHPKRSHIVRTASDPSELERVDVPVDVVHPPTTCLPEHSSQFMILLSSNTLGSDQVYHKTLPTLITPSASTNFSSDQAPNTPVIQLTTPFITPSTSESDRSSVWTSNNHIITTPTLGLTEGTVTYEELENGLKAVDGGGGSGHLLSAWMS